MQPLCDALKDDDRSVRGSSATALGALGDRSAVQPLMLYSAIQLIK